MAQSKCKRMTVHAMGIDEDGKVEYARNGNLGVCRNIPGKCGCTHAEINLLKKMPYPVHVTVSHSPCINCARALVTAGVKSVQYFSEYRMKDGLNFLLENEVTVYSPDTEGWIRVLR